MEEEKREDSESPDKIFDLLAKIRAGGEITVKDDQYEFDWVLDAVKQYRQNKQRFRLIDSGRFECVQLEILAASGADIYSSDASGRSSKDFEFINIAAKKGGALAAVLIEKESGADESDETLSPERLNNLGRGGLFLHVTARYFEWDLPLLGQLANHCRRGGSWLVYYHYGSISPDLISLGQNGSWIHLSSRNIRPEKNLLPLLDIIRSAGMQKAGVVIHLENELPSLVVKELLEAGGYVLFKGFQVSYKSSLKPLELKASEKKLDYRAYYLYPTVFP